MPKQKSLFQSKSAFLGFLLALAGILNQFQPNLASWIQENITFILTAAGAATVFLRIITKDAISIFPEHDPTE